MPSRRSLERLLLLIGLICLGTVAYAYLDARLTEKEENRRLDEAIAAQQSKESGPATETDSFAALKTAPPKLEEGALVGRIEIPRVGVAAIVLEGVDARTLRRGVGHIPGTDLPFQKGNVGLAGHRDSFFRALKDISKNDKITLTTPEGIFNYQVEWTRIVQPEDTGVLTDEGQPALTLVTCYPFYYVGSAPKRFIVRAVRLAEQTESM